MSFRNKRFNPLMFAYIFVLAALAATGYWAEDYHLRILQQQKLNGPESPTALVFMNLPRMNITLSSPDGGSARVKIAVSLQVMRKNALQLQDFQPRISDRIIGFLREQNIEEIRMPTSSLWLKKSLLKEANNAANNQVPVTDLVFRQFLVQ